MIQETYHIATNEVVSSEFGINPANNTRISKAQYSKHTIAAEGRASFKIARMKLNDSNENPCHVGSNLFEQMT